MGGVGRGSCKALSGNPAALAWSADLGQAGISGEKRRKTGARAPDAPGHRPQVGRQPRDHGPSQAKRSEGQALRTNPTFEALPGSLSHPVTIDNGSQAPPPKLAWRKKVALPVSRNQCACGSGPVNFTSGRVILRTNKSA